MNTKGDKGFTLIEILVVVAVIGLLAATIISSLEAKARVRDEKRWIEIKQLEKAIIAYGNIKGEWPGISDTNAVHISPYCASDLINDLIAADLLDHSPLDPLDDSGSDPDDCTDNKNNNYYYGWDSIHCCGSCLAPSSSTCQMCISVNRFETAKYKNKYYDVDKAKRGDANIGKQDDYNKCFDIDITWPNE